jgi:predicted AAA+ superfamily ATPase
LFEWLVLQELLKHNQEDVKYWRTKTKQEVDFVVDNIISVDAIEVKFKEKLSNSDYAGLLKFKEIYKNLVKEAYLLSKYWTKQDFKQVKNVNLFSFLAKYFE